MTTVSAPSVLITGCSPGGIGNALARQFHRRGFQVIATARTTDKLSDLKALGLTTLALTVDSEDSIQECVKQVETLCGGRLDYLINNAGTNLTIPALDVNLDDARKCFETNFFAVVRLVQVFSPLLITAKGTIVMVGSLAAEMPFVFGSVYNASKAALLSYSDTLRVELAPFDVKVITLITGGVRSLLTTKTDRVLPATSRYKPIEEHFNRRKLYSAHVGMDPDLYAESVIKQILPGTGPWPWRWFTPDARKSWIWVGSGAWLVWFVTQGWRRNHLLDWYFTRKFGLSRVRGQADHAKSE